MLCFCIGVGKGVVEFFLRGVFVRGIYGGLVVVVISLFFCFLDRWDGKISKRIYFCLFVVIFVCDELFFFELLWFI